MPPADERDAERLRLYAYATARESGDYVAIMRLFAGSLLAEWSAHDVAERGVRLPPEIIEQRLRYLQENGNLLASPREVRVTSIAEYQRQPAALHGHLARRPGPSPGRGGARRRRRGARGPSRTARRRRPPAVMRSPTSVPAASPQAAPAELLETTSTVFLQYETFAAAVTDFYTYVGSVLARADLDDDEWLGFKRLLLDYLETIVDAISSPRRHDPPRPLPPRTVARRAARAPGDSGGRRRLPSAPRARAARRSSGRSAGRRVTGRTWRAWFGADGDAGVRRSATAGGGSESGRACCSPTSSG